MLLHDCTSVNVNVSIYNQQSARKNVNLEQSLLEDALFSKWIGDEKFHEMHFDG